jgi:hypothetical protein
MLPESPVQQELQKREEILFLFLFSKIFKQTRIQCLKVSISSDSNPQTQKKM